MAYKPPHARAHRVYQPGKRHMELMPSLIQEEYRAFIEGKVDDFWKRHPYGRISTDADARRRQEEQENILILFRKLREGLLATDRKDAFALEAYETSLHLSIIFRSDKQTTSVLSHLPHLYGARPGAADPTHTALPTTLLSLLHHLLLGYPSQSRYHEHLYSLPGPFLPRDSAAYRWIAQLTHSLRTRNYAKLQELTDRDAFEGFFVDPGAPDEGGGHPPSGETSEQIVHQSAGQPNLALEAMCTLVEGIRDKARATAWLVMRSAYRELHCVPLPVSAPKTTDKEPSPTSEWLARSLALRPLGPLTADVSEMMRCVNEWLEQKCGEGEVKRKEGPEGRWVVNKVPVKM